MTTSKNSLAVEPEIREHIAEAISVGLQQWAALGIDNTPGVSRQEFLALCVTDAIAERAWIVPKVAYDENMSVRPYVRNGWIRREAGTSDPDHTRFYAAQLLAAADTVEAGWEAA